MSTPIAQPSGSPVWQIVFISFAVGLVLFEILRGWNRGIARQLARLAALIAAYFAAFFGGAPLVPILRPYINMPDRVVSIVAGALLALIIYALVNALGAVFFKKTKQYDSAMARVFCGLGGAVVGLFFGWFLVWVVVVGVRSFGTIADAIQEQSATQPGGSLPRTLHAVDVRRRLAGQTTEDSSTLMASLARLKSSLELGSVGEIVKHTDVVPSQTYETLNKIARVAADPESMQRFLSFPGTESLTNHPRIVALRDDPEVPQLIEQGRFLDLLQNQRVIDAMNDTTLIDEIRKIDLQRALDFATQPH